MGKIGDLFIRLGLKSDDFKRGIEEAKTETQGFGSAVTGVKGIAIAAWGAIAKEVSRFAGEIGKSIVHSTQVLEDAWGQAMEKMKAGWGVFSSAVANLDFTHLFANMREASRLAGLLYNAADALGENNTSYNISYSKRREEIAKLKKDLRNMGLSDEARLAAGNSLLDIFGELEGNKTRGYSDLRDATLDMYMGKMGVKLKDLTDKQLNVLRAQYEDFFVWLGSEQGSSFNSYAQNVAKDMTKYGAGYWAAGRNAGVSDQYLKWAIAYNKQIGDKDREAIEKSITGYYEQQAKYSEETLRISTMMNSIKASGSGEGGTGILPSKEEVRSTMDIFNEFFDQSYAGFEKWEQDGIQVVLDNLQDDITETLVESLGAFDRFFDESYAAWEQWQNEDISNLLDNVQDEITGSLQKTSFDLNELVSGALTAAVDGFTDAMQELFDSLSNLEDVDGSAITAALLTPLCETAKRMGEVMMTIAAGEIAMLDSITNPWALLAAGAALVAIGAAGKAALSSIVSGGTATTTATTSSGLSSGVTSSELTVYVKGTIKGSDILISGQNTMNEWNK